MCEKQQKKELSTVLCELQTLFWIKVDIVLMDFIEICAKKVKIVYQDLIICVKKTKKSTYLGI